jgi:hypothetical protein
VLWGKNRKYAGEIPKKYAKMTLPENNSHKTFGDCLYRLANRYSIRKLSLRGVWSSCISLEMKMLQDSESFWYTDGQRKNHIA